jgi:hypothetical protein
MYQVRVVRVSICFRRAVVLEALVDQWDRSYNCTGTGIPVSLSELESLDKSVDQTFVPPIYSYRVTGASS